MNKPRICVCSLSLGDEYKKVTRWGRETKLLYTQKHGYDFKDDEDIYDRTRHPAWSKILLMLRYLRYYDYVCWIDADTFIMNDEITLESLICKHMITEDIDTEFVDLSRVNHYDIMVAQDWKMINTGVMLIRNSEWAYSFLTELYESPGEFVNQPNYEQNTFIDFYDNNTLDCNDHILVLPLHLQNELNSYYFTYFYGNFIIHFCGCNLTQLSLPMTKYCPIKRDDDTDESYSQRMFWLEHICRQETDEMLQRIYS